MKRIVQGCSEGSGRRKRERNTGLAMGPREPCAEEHRRGKAKESNKGKEDGDDRGAVREVRREVTVCGKTRGNRAWKGNSESETVHRFFFFSNFFLSVLR